MRAGRSADDVEGVVHIGDPVAQRLVHRVFQCGRASGNGHDFRAKQLHPEHVGRLTGDVGCAHVDHARQAEARADGGGCHAVLARAGFRDDPGLAHADRQQDLADAVVDLVRAGVIQLIALEPDLGAAQFFGQTRCEIERAGPADVVLQQVVELSLEGRVLPGRIVLSLEIENQRHQRFGDITAAKLAEMASLVRLVAEGICRAGRGHDGPSDWQSGAVKSSLGGPAQW